MLVKGIPRIYYLTYRFSHHNATSGYDRLGDFINSSVVETPSWMGNLLTNVFRGSLHDWLIKKTGLTGYFPECVWLEMRAFLRLKSPFRSILHFIYPENSYYFTSKFRRGSGCKILCTYHQPVEQCHQFIKNNDPIKHLDAVILLAGSQREYFEPLVGKERIFVVPYGIDLERFPNGKSQRDPQRIIAVGNWLRDFKTLVGALEVLERRAPKLRCDVVTLQANRPYFEKLKNVDFYSGISHEALLQLYARASISILTYSTAAASGALLESLASGLPIIATDLPSIREYTNPHGCRYVAPFDSDALADEILQLSGEQSALAPMGRTNAEHAKQFEWKNIAQKTMEVYNIVSNW